MDSEYHSQKTARYTGGNLQMTGNEHPIQMKETDLNHSMLQREGDVRRERSDMSRYFTCKTDARPDKQQNHGSSLDLPRDGTGKDDNGSMDNMVNYELELFVKKDKSEDRQLTRKEQLLVWQQKKDAEQTRSYKSSSITRRRSRKAPLSLQFVDRNEAIEASEPLPQRWKNETNEVTFDCNSANQRNAYLNTKGATLSKKHSNRNFGASATEFSTSSSAESKSYGYEVR